MMKTPTPVEVQTFFAHMYDPVKAHEYYIKNRKLKGRKPAAPKEEPQTLSVGSRSMLNPRFTKDPRTGKTMDQIHKDARAKQRAELSQQIKTLEAKLSRLSALIVKKQHEQDAAERKSMGKKERAAKEKTKPKTAAEKAEAARESKKYRDKHQQELKTEAKSNSSSKSGGDSSKESQSKTTSLATEISRLDALATKVAGKIAVAKDKLAAL